MCAESGRGEHMRGTREEGARVRKGGKGKHAHGNGEVGAGGYVRKGGFNIWGV